MSQTTPVSEIEVGAIRCSRKRKPEIADVLRDEFRWVVVDDKTGVLVPKEGSLQELGSYEVTATVYVRGETGQRIIKIQLKDPEKEYVVPVGDPLEQELGLDASKIEPEEVKPKSRKNRWDSTGV